MDNVSHLRPSTPPRDPTLFSPASGAPRPMVMRRVIPADPIDFLAPVIRMPVRPDRVRDPGPGSGPAEPPPSGEAVNAAELRQVRNLSRSVGQAAIEALAGIRPVHQLARWLDADNFEKLTRRAELTRAAETDALHGVPPRLHRSPAVTSTRVCLVAPGIYEASLVVAEQKRVRAVALRIERRRGLWKVTALEIG